MKIKEILGAILVVIAWLLGFISLVGLNYWFLIGVISAVFAAVKGLGLLTIIGWGFSGALLTVIIGGLGVGLATLISYLGTMLADT